MDKMKINQFHTTDVKELSINGTTVTTTAAELNAIPCGAVASMTTVETGASGSCGVQLVFSDAAGVVMAVPTSGIVYVSEDATGLIHDTAPTGLAVLTNGALTEVLTGTVALFTTDATGKLGITITAAADDYYLVVVLSSGKLLISEVCVVDA